MTLTARRIEAILFDKDGTLFDFAATWNAWADALLARLAGPDRGRAEALAAAIGFDRATCRFLPESPVIAGTTREAALRLLPHLPDARLERLEALLVAEAARAPQVPAVPLAPLLDALAARGLRLGVATNDAAAAARAHLDAAGVADRFDFVAGYDSGFGGKPAPGQLLAFADAVGIPPARIAMVGDSLHDLHAARAAGMTALAVLTGPATAADLQDAADAVLPHIGGLPGWLDAAAPSLRTAHR
ncbi:HAD family hydrolase [Roseivivax isoporae]|uniref:phosphoglycolate phosphatase n=1 Tax=Roseivivax isoporae LMG 25204 TaxID=1449351 RepID=X7F8E4_9RHOB|nr:phosphatase [Roseivivax isoporae LMG 25204]